MRAPSVLVLSLGVALGSSGCLMLRKDGDRLEAEAAARDARIAALEQGVAEERARLSESVESAQAKVAELEQVLERATEVVTRNSADVGLEVQQLRAQLQALEGQLAELRHELGEQVQEQSTAMEQRIEQFARRAGVDMPVAESEIPQDRAEHYRAGRAALDAGDHSRARALLRAYVERYPQDDLADDALLGIGQSYLAQDRPASALGALRSIVADHARGDALDDALLAMGDAFFRLRACTDARSALDTLVRSFPRSPHVAAARAKLREIQRAPAAACTS